MNPVKSNSVAFVFCLILVGCEKKEEMIAVGLTPSQEECDNFSCIWMVDSVYAGSILQKDDYVYLVNSKATYKTRDLKLKVFGTSARKVIDEHYTDCGVVYRLNDFIPFDTLTGNVQ